MNSIREHFMFDHPPVELRWGISRDELISTLTPLGIIVSPHTPFVGFQRWSAFGLPVIGHFGFSDRHFSSVWLGPLGLGNVLASYATVQERLVALWGVPIKSGREFSNVGWVDTFSWSIGDVTVLHGVWERHGADHLIRVEYRPRLMQGPPTC